MTIIGMIGALLVGVYIGVLIMALAQIAARRTPSPAFPKRKLVHHYQDVRTRRVA
jgi:hypothetical protein